MLVTTLSKTCAKQLLPGSLDPAPWTLVYMSEWQFFGRADLFRPSHVHTDVKLALGWTSTVIAAATSLYSYRTPFQESRFWVIVGVVV
jgi:Microsomal signal peptidase 25 kDa subunit (SPC25)